MYGAIHSPHQSPLKYIQAYYLAQNAGGGYILVVKKLTLIFDGTSTLIVLSNL